VLCLVAVVAFSLLYYLMKDSAESAKQEVAECEKEINAIKAQLRSLGPATDEGAGNTLQVSYTKVGTTQATAILIVMACLTLCSVIHL